MDWVYALRGAIDYMEQHLTDDISVQDIAANAYISPIYLQKGFQIPTGLTLSEYLRNRRLYLAAMELSTADCKIIDIALKYGYDTPESFSKAFTRFHGCSPMQMKREHCPAKPFLPLQISILIQGGNAMNFKISTMFPIQLIGFVRKFSYETSYQEIPKFWSEIWEKYATPLYQTGEPKNSYERAIRDNCIGEYGVCLDDCADGKTFRYMIAGKYTGGEVPDGMELVEIPQFDWAKFKCVGPIPAALQSLNTQIFREWLPNNPDYEIAAGLNIEWYSSEGNQTDADYESGIWVPVRKKQ